MPKIPIEFNFGDYQDDNPKLGNRLNYNCYPETTVGSVNKTILRSVEGYSMQLNDAERFFSSALFFNGVLYYISDGNFYSSLSPYNTSNFIDFIPSLSSINNIKMVSNGKNIVMLSPTENSPSDDYYYDFATNSVDKIVNKDPNYASFNKVKDVIFKDGYYLFITRNSVFHGDNISLGDGLSFNPLSFDPIGSADGDGVGLSDANGVAYAFTTQKTFLYQVSPSTPFSFSKIIGQDIDIGLASTSAKVEFEDQIFLVANKEGGSPQAVIISGTNFQYIGNHSSDDYLAEYAIGNRLQVSTYEIRGHRMIHCTPFSVIGLNVPSLCLDYSESNIQGRPVWHLRAPADVDGFGRGFIYQYLNSSRADPTNQIYAMGVNSIDNTAALYVGKDDQSYPNLGVFGGESIDGKNGFQFTFPFIRNDGDPVYIKSIRLRFADNVSEVFLDQSIGGGNYFSLGLFDLTNVDSKTAEWRRIGRINEDVSFKVSYRTEAVNRFEPSMGNKPSSLIEGYFLV